MHCSSMQRLEFGVVRLRAFANKRKQSIRKTLFVSFAVFPAEK